MREFCRVVNRLWSKELEEEYSFSCWELLSSIRKVNSFFEGFQQHDAHEVMLTVIDACMDESMLLRHAFEGKLKSELVCGNCCKRNVKVESTIGLSLGMGSNIEECLKDYFREELLSEGNEWVCEHCKEKDSESTIQYTLEEPPEILPIHIKRFRNEEKISAFVEFSLQMAINNVEYELFALACHIGSSREGGHYVAKCKVRDSKWIEFDDSQCYSVTQEDVLDSQAYVLFYKKRRASHVPNLELLSGDSVWVLPKWFCCKLKTFSSVDEPVKASEWIGPVQPVPKDISEQFGGMPLAQYEKEMYQLESRKRSEMKTVLQMGSCEMDERWTMEWLDFIRGKRGPPSNVPDQEEKNQLWTYFKSLYN